MERRTVIKIVALGALTSQADILRTPGYAADSLLAWSPADYQLRFFTLAESELAGQLMELIIPADGHSPGARAAQVDLFADWMVSTSDDEDRARWRGGLELMRNEAAKSSLPEALAKAAAGEKQPTTGLEHFFAVLKRMTIDGYYTSSVGIHQDLQYVGNTYLSAFPGCSISNLRS